MKSYKLEFISESGRPVSDSLRLELIIHELEAIQKRELSKHQMDSWPGLDDVLDEVISLLDGFINYEPSDVEMMGEPPMTAAELHSAAWQQHQELHS